MTRRKRKTHTNHECVTQLPTWTPVFVSKRPMRYAYDGLDARGRRWRAWYAGRDHDPPNVWLYAPVDNLSDVKHHPTSDQVDDPTRHALEQLGQQLARG